MKVVCKIIALALSVIAMMSVGSIAPDDKKNLVSDMYYATATDFKPIYLNAGADSDYLFADEHTDIGGETSLTHMLCVISVEAEQQLQSHTQFPVRENHFWLNRC